MTFPGYTEQLNIEWLGISALREVVKIATRGDMRATYEQVIKLGKKLYPELYNSETSILVKENESDTIREYRQRAEAETVINQRKIFPLDLIREEIDKLNTYIKVSLQHKNYTEVDRLKSKIVLLEKASDELDEHKNTENDILLRDVYDVDRVSPLPHMAGKKFRDFSISSDKRLRIRLLHPDRPEHISGADIIYEHHDLKKSTTRLAAVQYKLWDNKELYYDNRMAGQLDKLHKLFCENNLCASSDHDSYRFPYCSAFLRPTDKIQKGNQRLVSSGQHIPICRINNLWKTGSRGGVKLTYQGIKKSSISGETFELLFNNEKVGSREFQAYEIDSFYKDNDIFEHNEKIIIHAQEYNEHGQY